MDQASPILSIVIVSYNTRELTLQCLRALYADLANIPAQVPAEIFIVDNASSDGSPAAITAEFPSVIMIKNKDNLGFGAANNIAMARATGRYILLLNSDAFLHPGALAALLTLADAHPDTAVVGPRILCPDGSLQLSCFRFTTPARAWYENLWLSQIFRNHPTIGDYRQWPHDTDRYVDFVIGACMLVRRTAYQQVGGFDEAFFMYSEEADWQWRMARAGWKVAFTPTAVVTHVGGASGTGEKARVNRHFFDSLDLYVRKHHGRLGLMSLRAAMAVGCAIRAVLWTGAWIVSPKRRAAAAAKMRLLWWLVARQITYWPRMGAAAV